MAEPFARTLTGSSRCVAKSFQLPAPDADPAGYLDALLALVQREQVDLLQPVSEETMHVAQLHGHLPPGVRLATSAPERLLTLHSKQGFAAQAGALGLTVPETHPLGSPGAQALVQQQDVVVKPEFSCGGQGLRRVARGQGLPAADPQQPAVVQAAVTGQELSTCSLAHAGRLLGTVVYRGALMAGTVAVAFERVTPSPALADWLTRFVAASGHSGFISLDLMVDADDTPWPIECNPRATSGVHFFEAAHLGQALADPAAFARAGQPLRWRAETRLQQFYSALTELSGAMFTRRYGPQLKALLGTPDVSWQARDPWPFLGMTATSWPILRAALRERRPFGEVAMRDLSWTAAHQRAWLAQRDTAAP